MTFTSKFRTLLTKPVSRIESILLTAVLVPLLAATVASAATTISTDIMTGGSLSVTGTTTMIGKVGVGSTTPYAKLSVTGAGTGSGVAVQVTDSSNAPKFTVLDNGFIGIGTTTPESFIDTAFNGGGGMTLTSFRTSSLGGNITLNHARGTQATPIVVNAGDSGGNIYFQVLDPVTSTFKIVGNINSTYKNNNSTDKDYGDIRFLVNSTPDELMRIGGSASAGNAISMFYGSSMVNNVGFDAVEINGRLGIGTTTPYSRLHVTAGASATTTVNFGEVGISSSKACFNTKNTTGSDISFYFAGTSMVVENNPCR